MKNKNTSRKGLRLAVKKALAFGLALVAVSGMHTSCEVDESYKIAPAGPLQITASAGSLVLNQKFAANTALSYDWTTGNNGGSGASISYRVQIDKKGNNFANPLTVDKGKANYNHKLTTGALNELLLSRWDGSPGVEMQLEARVVSTVYSQPVTTDTSNVVELLVTPYRPVSQTLYLIGSAAPNGWNAGSASPLTPQADPTVFVFQGALSVGEFKFITALGQFLPSYNKGADESHMAYRTDDSQPDAKFTVAEAAVYKVTVSLLDLTVSMAKVDLPAYEHIYMVGSAAPNGWDITNATPLQQDNDNPFVFRYTGVMQAGEFKFPVNRNADWGQDMFMRVDDTKMYLHKGGESDDNKWAIAKKGYYTITLDLLGNTIDIARQELYMVGSATPIGWNIGQSIKLVESENDGCVFTYTGAMVEGEFKFPVNRNSDWGQDMYMRLDNTTMYRHKGGEPDDNKWNITSAGNYVITANVETLAVSIQKQ